MKASAARLALIGGLAMPAGAALAQVPPASTAPPLANPVAPVAAPPGGLSPAGVAQPPPVLAAAAVVRTENAAVALLVQQGRRWLAQGRPALAVSSAERALAAAPHDVGALMLATEANMAAGNRTAASAYVDQLGAAGATPAELERANAILHQAEIDPAALAEARQLARAGRADEAAVRYQSLFGASGPPPAYAREYYQVLAAAPSTRTLGLQGLSRLAGAADASQETLLAYAQSLTYAPGTRAEGIARLAVLSARPDVGVQARAAWRQALGFYGNDPAVLPQIATYLQRFPGDPVVTRQEQAVRTAQPAPATPAQLAVQAAYADLNRGALSAAERQFNTILAANPNDPDALAGLGIERLRENRPADARDLLQRATAAAPDRASQWARALDAANYALELAQARSLLARGDAAGAETVLRQAMNRDVDDKTDAESMLGDVALRQHHPEDAEQMYRAALSHRPGFAPAITGLNRALRAEGRGGEVVPEPRTAATGRAVPPEGVSAAGYVPGRSAPTTGARAQAAATSDPNVQVAILTGAMNASPNDPWVRFDLAHALRRLGRAPEGRAIMEELLARQSTPDTNYAAALLAQEDGRLSDAQALMARIPVRRLTPDMARMQSALQHRQDVASAAAMLSSSPFVARQRLMMLAARPDPSGGTAADVIRALADAGDLAGAAQAGQTAELVNTGTDARIAIAGAFAAAGLGSYANAAIARLDTGSLTPAQRQTLSVMQTEAAIQVSDKLNERNDQAAAFERLRPALMSDPNNPDVQLALARLYQGAGQPAAAAQIAAAVLTRDPRNMDARSVAVGAAIDAGNRGDAAVIANEAAAVAPGDARALLLQARVARANGEFSRARTLLAEAAASRQAELGATPQTAAYGAAYGAGAMPNPFTSSGYDPGTASGLQNPFGASAAGTAGPSDAVAREIAREQAALREETASHATGGVTVRIRSGTAGLDELTDISTPLTASFVPERIGGRITAGLTPVLLDNGTLSGSENILRFGSNAATGRAAVPSNGMAEGVGLGLAYRLGSVFSADIGASPLGFPVKTMLGGIEVAPKLSNNVTLRVRAERRMITDSLLSYAGQRDPVTGTTWGGVTRNGGHGQLEIGLGAGGYAYAGAGYNIVTGEHVAQNNEIEAGAGFGYPIYKEGDSTLLSGLDLTYFRYANNQRGFTLGQGGYFSPQSFASIQIPLDYRSTYGLLQYHLRGAIGYDTFREDPSILFPLDPSLQAAANAAAAGNPDVPNRNLGQSKSGIVGAIQADLRYPLTDVLAVAAGVDFQEAPEWQQGSVWIKLDSEF